jgi:pyruvate ferredoxin oxidoreductase gamma subunit
MFQIRIHGRGGQGVVSAAEMVSVAAFIEGKHAQAFPSFGSERMGAPVVAFCRIDDREIRSREPIEEPDAVIVQDPTLLHIMDVFAGLKATGFALINSSHELEEIDLGHLLYRLPEGHVLALPASELALEHVGRPIPNAALLGGIAAMTGIVGIGSVQEAIHQKFPGAVGERNCKAAQAAFDAAKVALRATVKA